jgi:hypothetical protein
MTGYESRRPCTREGADLDFKFSRKGPIYMNKIKIPLAQPEIGDEDFNEAMIHS